MRRPWRWASSTAATVLVGLPLSFDGVRPPFEQRAPTLGEDNKSVLGGQA